MPSRGTPALPEGAYIGNFNVGLPNDDADPVKSPDDPVAETSNESQSFSSSKDPGLDKILEKASDEDQQTAKRKARGGDKYGEKPAEHKETPSEDIEVGKFEIERKNWKAALSRFESALVLSPDDPEVYWGLAESERGLGQFAEARANYKKLLDYDPDGPHGKAARKALNDPQIAHAQAAAPAAAIGTVTKQ
jgi:tetratricopeptide (TPR) repeat protein